MTRVIVCGGRNFADRELMDAALDRLHKRAPFTLLIHGKQRGADVMAGEWARSRNVPLLEIEAEWTKYGHGAGPIRNKRMLVEGMPSMVVAFPGNIGTANMIKQARAAEVRVVEVDSVKLRELT